MENKSYSDSKISIVINFYKAQRNIIDAALNQISKSKQELDVLLLVDEIQNEKIINELTEKGKLQQLIFDTKQTLASNISSCLKGAVGQSALILFNPAHNIGSLLAWINTNKKNFAAETFYVGSQNLKSTTTKVKTSFAEKIYNSILRFYTPLNLKDNNSGVIICRTALAEDCFHANLNSSKDFVQILYSCYANNIKLHEINISAEKKPTLPWASLIKNIFATRWNYFVSSPLNEIKIGKSELSLLNGNHPVYRMLFFVGVLACCFLMPYLSQDFGSTWDEKAHNEYSQLSYNYFMSFGEDKAALAEAEDNSQYIRQAYRYYGEQLNTVAAFMYNWFGTGVYETRHFVNSIYGLVAIIFVGLSAFLLSSWRGAFIALLFMFFNPGWLGNSMNNPTDIPFATGFAVSTYYMLRILKSMPKPKLSHIILLGIGIGIGIGSRIGGLLILAYFGLFLGVSWLALIKQNAQKGRKEFFKYVKVFILVGLLGYIFGVILWPYGLSNPFTNPILAFSKAAENAFYTNNVELFEGHRLYMINDAPWYYVIKFLAIGNPIYLLLGLALSVILIKWLADKIGWGYMLMLLFMVIFPIVYVELSNLNYYNGWRHYLFVLPSLVIISAVVYDYLLSKKVIAVISLVILSGLFLKPAAWVVSNHPNEYVYFNELVGGLKGAYGNYETDYYSNSCREAAEWVAKQHPNGKLKVVINNEITTASYWAHKINPEIEFYWTREVEEQKQNWDYLILTSRTFSKNELLNGSFPPKGTVYTVMADGIPLAAVVKREDWNMYLGYAAMDGQKVDSAITYFTEAVKYAPKDEEGWRMLGFSYIVAGSFDSAEMMTKKAIEINPDNYAAYGNMGLIYFNRKEFQKCTEFFKKSTDLKENIVESWYYSALAYISMNDYNTAIKNLQMSIKHNSGFPDAYYYLGKSYEEIGNLDKAASNLEMCLGINQKFTQAWLDLANIYTKQRRPREAQFCMDRYKEQGGS